MLIILTLNSKVWLPTKSPFVRLSNVHFRSAVFISLLFPVVLNSSRWIKFEEKVEKGGERWSKPHVATLSLHSLFELRTCIEKGTIMLDMEASSLSQVVGKLSAGHHSISRNIKENWIQFCLIANLQCFLMAVNLH